MEFFNFDDECPSDTNQLITNMQKLDYKQTNLILDLVKEINKLKRK